MHLRALRAVAAGLLLARAHAFSSSGAADDGGSRRSGDSSRRAGVLAAIGNTPLLELRTLSAATGCRILAKAEHLNAGGSVKDRAALYLVALAERAGALRPGGTVVEGTAGNTGIGLAHVCNSRGYRLVIFMPDTQSQENVDLLRMLGADVRPVPAVPITDPRHYTFQAREHALALGAGSVWTNQFVNVHKRTAHLATTGQEI